MNQGELRKYLIEMFKSAIKIRIGDTLNIVSGKKEIERIKAKANKALMRGEEIVWEDGRIQWIDDMEKYPYIWHEDGNRVLNERWLVTKIRGKITKEKIKELYLKIK